MIEAGALADADLVFYMSFHEVRQLLRTRSPIIVQKASRRKRMRPAWDDLRFDEMIYGVPKPFDSNSAAVAIDTADDGSFVVKGTPVSRGVYKGKARVVTRLADAETIQKGDVLITISTD